MYIVSLYQFLLSDEAVLSPKIGMSHNFWVTLYVLLSYSHFTDVPDIGINFMLLQKILWQLYAPNARNIDWDIVFQFSRLILDRRIDRQYT